MGSAVGRQNPFAARHELLAQGKFDDRLLVAASEEGGRTAKE